MNQAQKNYLLKRIKQIGELKKAAIAVPSAEYTYKLKPDKELIAILKAKIAKFGRTVPPDSYSTVWLEYRDLYEQSLVKKEREEYEKKVAQSLDKKNKIDKRVAEITDEVMIGDEKKAMELLAKFEKEVF